MILNCEIERFISEDLGANDISCTLVPETKINAIIFAKEDCVVAGIEVAQKIMEYFGIQTHTELVEGNEIKAGDTIFKITGNSVAILRAERLVLNFLGHLTGIATLTHRYVQTVRQYSDTKVAGTRKTTPGIRKFEKLAIIAGGGDPHRFDLSDAIMIKDNHRNAMGLENAIISAKELAGFTQKIDVEVETAEDAITAARLGVDIIMFDNMLPGQVIHTLEKLKREGVRDDVIIEVSGGINLDNISEYAKTGVDVISVGSLVHKAEWTDISLELVETDM
ncbi:carboxylating nicotinate-nucleotide diphosphorylase [Methanococcoides orientis]|uniref:carboxylating nicotinate-nucleotide diphosphorylase n=1 Tax=Methanococcoides orientis TaxID=2822137 RepID=UPI001E4C44B2|nr:carboxylating nicotinate-nucleotide diphosphorylase [Methanococcoides orientis]UGV40362.1 carboxylating nicotinate-nucleotide diphosphorylase [Methanococcoides orientis]